MNELNQVALDSVDGYFEYIKENGYISYENSKKVFLISFINEFLKSDISNYLTQEDYSIIDKALYCIYNSSCLIPYPDYMLNRDAISFGSKKSKVRITEFEEDIRISEDGGVRTTKE